LELLIFVQVHRTIDKKIVSYKCSEWANKEQRNQQDWSLEAPEGKVLLKTSAREDKRSWSATSLEAASSEAIFTKSWRSIEVAEFKDSRVVSWINTRLKMAED
jgi:DNA polymerase III delta subunit